MYEKIFTRVVVKDGLGIRLIKDYLRVDEMKQIVGTLKLMGATFTPRLNLWILHPNNIPRFEAVLYNLNRQVEARSEIEYSSLKEQKSFIERNKMDRLTARAFKTVVFKTRGSHCEACGGVGEVHYRIIPRYIASADTVENFRILCRSCQTKVRHYFNRCVAEELAKRDAVWLEDKFDEVVTMIVEGE